MKKRKKEEKVVKKPTRRGTHLNSKMTVTKKQNKSKYNNPIVLSKLFRMIPNMADKQEYQTWTTNEQKKYFNLKQVTKVHTLTCSQGTHA